MRGALVCALAGTAAIASTSISACSSSLPSEKKNDLGLDTAPEGKVVAKLSFTRSVTTTVPAGENVIVTYEDKDFAVLDMSEPATPGEPVTLVTNSKIVAVEYDDERGFAYAVDVNGALWFVNLRSAAGAELLRVTTTAPAIAGKATTVTRVGDRVFVLAGNVLQPFSITLSDGVPNSVIAEAAVTLGRAAVTMTAGAGVLYVALDDGTLEAWDGKVAASTRLGTISIGGQIKSVLAKGSKVIVLSKTVGLKVVDFGTPSNPGVLLTQASLDDVESAKLFGRTLLVGLARNYVSSLDLSDFTLPKAVTTNKGTLPAFMVVVNGNAVWGTGKDAQVVGVPPVVTTVIPAIIKTDFPADGQIPVTFSKPIDPASATADAVKVSCNATPVTGTIVVSFDKLTVSFRASSALPLGANCSIDVTGIKDALGQAIVQGSQSTNFTFNVSRAAPAPVQNPGSKFGHTADGKFTGFGGSGAGDAGTSDATAPATGDAAGVEWSDVKPAKGMYTYFYADFDGQNLWILNDWFYNGDNIDPDCYNQFNAWTGGGTERWDIRAYGNQRVEVRKNGVLVEGNASGVTGGAGYFGSPNVSSPHTIYEIKIPAAPGTWGVQLHDPGPSFHCSTRMGDPSSLSGQLTGGAQNSSTVGTGVVTIPQAPVLLSPEDKQTSVPLQPTLAWRSDNRTENFPTYQIELARNLEFRSGYWTVSTTATSYTLPKGLLVGGTTYFWRVSASNSAGRATSGIRSFTTPITLQPGQSLLTVGTTGMGTVTSSPSGITCGATCQAAFATGTEVTLTAKPVDGWQFSNWGGDCTAQDNAPDGSGVAKVVLSQTRACTATFRMVAATSYTLAVSVVGPGSVIGPANLSCPQAGCTTSVAYPALSTQVLAANPAQGARFVNWTGNCSGTNPSLGVYMDRNKSCTANFQTVTNNTLTVAVSPQAAGNVTAVSPSGQISNCGGGGGCSGTYSSDTTVSLVASPTSNYRFLNWSGDCAGTDNSLGVPMTTNKSCTAVFQATIPMTVTKTGQGSGTVTMSGSGGGTASCGTQCITSLSRNYDQGTTVTYDATAAQGSTFAGWSGCSTSTSAQIQVSAVMATTCTARFDAAPPQNLTVNVTGQGTVVSSPSLISCGAGNTACSGELPQGTSVNLTATASSGWMFTGWSNCSTSTSRGIQFTLSSATTCVATFTQTPSYALNVTIAGMGTVTSQNPAGMNCANGSGTCSIDVPQATQTTLTATAASGYAFRAWSGCSTSTSRSIAVTMDMTKTCTANFDAVNTLAVSVSGTGSVSSSPAGISCGTGSSGTCSAAFTANSNVMLTATAGQNNTFSGWSGCSTATTDTITVTMDAARTCTATFATSGVPLTVNITGTANTQTTVTSMPSGINYVRNAQMNSGTSMQTFSPSSTVMLTGAIGADAAITSWTCNSQNMGTGGTISVTLPATGSMTCVLRVDAKYTLTVAPTPATSGVVSSISPNTNISCGSACSATYDPNQQVQLFATAVQGKSFTGWSGSLPGCSGTSAITTVTVNATGTCTANFTP
ncbi:MAG: Ig-like domain-containing protein [Polyangiaceae bacterium]